MLSDLAPVNLLVRPAIKGGIILVLYLPVGKFGGVKNRWAHNKHLASLVQELLSKSWSPAEAKLCTSSGYVAEKKVGDPACTLSALGKGGPRTRWEGNVDRAGAGQH